MIMIFANEISLFLPLQSKSSDSPTIVMLLETSGDIGPGKLRGKAFALFQIGYDKPQDKCETCSARVAPPARVTISPKKRAKARLSRCGTALRPSARELKKNDTAAPEDIPDGSPGMGCLIQLIASAQPSMLVKLKRKSSKAMVNAAKLKHLESFKSILLRDSLVISCLGPFR